ncbi:MAG: CapA family protein, partial [Candidatus Cloacimonadaceae bacterium]|nr:CapA family protein [Candidatus Cloacimonadaceae bacterium]
VLEDFESGNVVLQSWLDEDIQPTLWNLDSSVTYNSSLYSLRLSGNTWKQQIINPVTVDSNAVFQVAARAQTGARFQGIGFNDGTNTLFYSFSGNTVMNIETWVPVYQGQYSQNTWNLYQLPIADDWWAFFDYLPIITSIVYVNDNDGISSPRSIWFDDIWDISSDLPIAPQVNISYDITTRRINNNFNRIVGVQFTSVVTDPDSDTHTYQWDFGDSTYSSLANPYKVFTVTDNRPWRVSLRVTDSTGKWGLASCLIPVDTGDGTLPITMTFIGDVMLARRYEQAGGIIPTLGVNAIFEPTRHLLGGAADITVANLEVPLTNQGTPHPTKSVVYRGNPNNVAGLVHAGINIVSTANNHTLDYGLAGLQQTQQVLDQAGILHSGAGANSYEAYTPAFINKNGLNIAFLRSSDRTGQYNNAQPYLQAGYNKPGFAYLTPYYIGRQIEMVQGIADLKIVEMHGGS